MAVLLISVALPHSPLNDPHLKDCPFPRCPPPQVPILLRMLV